MTRGTEFGVTSIWYRACCWYPKSMCDIRTSRVWIKWLLNECLLCSPWSCGNQWCSEDKGQAEMPQFSWTWQVLRKIPKEVEGRKLSASPHAVSTCISHFGHLLEIPLPPFLGDKTFFSIILHECLWIFSFHLSERQLPPSRAEMQKT